MESFCISIPVKVLSSCHGRSSARVAIHLPVNRVWPLARHVGAMCITYIKARVILLSNNIVLRAAS